MWKCKKRLYRGSNDFSEINDTRNFQRQEGEQGTKNNMQTHEIQRNELCFPGYKDRKEKKQRGC